MKRLQTRIVACEEIANEWRNYSDLARRESSPLPCFDSHLFDTLMASSHLHLSATLGHRGARATYHPTTIPSHTVAPHSLPTHPRTLHPPPHLYRLRSMEHPASSRTSSQAPSHQSWQPMTVPRATGSSGTAPSSTRPAAGRRSCLRPAPIHPLRRGSS